MTNKLLYHIWRKSIIHSFFTNTSRDVYPDAYYFAISNEIYPYFHTGDRDENKDFDSFFNLNRDAVEELIKFLDKDFIAGNYKTFYEYEDILDVKQLTKNSPLNYKFDRLDLRNVIRYCYMEGCFNKEFYEILLSDCPSEAHRIKDDLSQIEMLYY
jgi:hypothetical protein